jgi:hypothetical protein
MPRLPHGVHDFFRSPQRTVRSLAWRALHPNARLTEPVFLVGSPRSGMKLAAQLLAAHPDVVTWLDSGRLWDPRDYHDAETEHHWPAERATTAEIRRLHRFCEWYRRSRGGGRFVNEHPRNAVRIAYLRRVFPDARFVHVIRDGRAVVGSMVSQIRSRARRQDRPLGGFCRPPGWRSLVRDDLVEQTALVWQALVRHVREQAASLGAAYREVRFEALCAEPRRTCAELASFAGLRGADWATLPERIEARGWLGRFEAGEVAVVEKVAGDLLAELGYR